MAIKKSELYSSLWASCDELRGGMDASQYKDYVLVLLFVKYVSDKYAGVPYAPITIPDGASFKDMIALKGKPDIGDQINKKIIGPLANANKLSDMPDFNDPSKLGSGQEIVDRLTNLISIFENKALDFSKNRADGDDTLRRNHRSRCREIRTFQFGECVLGALQRQSGCERHMAAICCCHPISKRQTLCQIYVIELHLKKATIQRAGMAITRIGSPQNHDACT